MAGVAQNPSDQKREDEYRAKDDARTMIESEAIRHDSHRLKHAKRHLRHAKRALARLSSRK